MSPLHQAVIELLWAAWTELGVPGGSRPLADTVIDPEPLLLVTPLVFELDPRLRDEVYSWCAQHHARLSTSRLRGLRSLTMQPAPWDRFACSLREREGVRWPGQGEPWPAPSRMREHTLRVDRPSMLRFRARALSGVGARADVLCELLARPMTWVRASDLGDLGYTKRAVAGILADLAGAGLASQRRSGNAVVFKLTEPEQLAHLVQAGQLRMPSWKHIGDLIEGGMALLALEAKAPTVRGVLAHQLRDPLSGAALRLGLAAPLRGKSELGAWEALVSWSEVQLRALLQR